MNVKNDKGQPTVGIAVDHRATEEALKNSGVPYVIPGNQLYNAGLVSQGAQAIARGEIVSNAGDGKWAPVARRDCAAAAAAVLACGSASFSQQTREGQIAVKSTAVKDLTGKEPQSVRELLEANKAKLVAPPTAAR